MKMSLKNPTVDEVRTELGSPSTDDISDDTLQRFIEEEKSLYGAAYRAAEVLARKYAFKADISVGDYRAALSKISDRWGNLAAEMKKRAAIYGQVPFVGGISKSQNELLNSDPDRPGPDFHRDMWVDRWT